MSQCSEHTCLPTPNTTSNVMCTATKTNTKRVKMCMSLENLYFCEWLYTIQSLTSTFYRQLSFHSLFSMDLTHFHIHPLTRVYSHVLWKTNFVFRKLPKACGKYRIIWLESWEVDRVSVCFVAYRNFSDKNRILVSYDIVPENNI